MKFTKKATEEIEKLKATLAGIDDDCTRVSSRMKEEAGGDYTTYNLFRKEYYRLRDKHYKVQAQIEEIAKPVVLVAAKKKLCCGKRQRL